MYRTLNLGKPRHIKGIQGRWKVQSNKWPRYVSVMSLNCCVTKVHVTGLLCNSNHVIELQPNNSSYYWTGM